MVIICYNLFSGAVRWSSEKDRKGRSSVSSWNTIFGYIWIGLWEHLQDIKFLQCFFIFVPTNPWRFHANVVFFERVFGKSGTILCQDAQAQFLAPGTEVDVEEGREAPRWGHTQLPVNQTWLAGKSDHFHRNFRTQKLRHQWQHPFPLFTCSQSHSRGEKRSLEWWRCGSSLQLQTQRS